MEEIEAPPLPPSRQGQRPRIQDTAPEFGQRLRKRRLEQGFSQTEFAEKVNLTPSSVSVYESGGTLPRVDIAYRLADALNTDLVALMGRDIVKG